MNKNTYAVIIITMLILAYFIGHQVMNSSKLVKNGMQIRIEEAQEHIERILNTKAEFFSDEGVIKVSFPRKDIKVTINEWPLDPFMGLTSWIAFQKGTKKGIEIMAMGDLVLLAEEVNPVMNIALDNDIKITALHNHFFYDNPKVYFMHLEAEGAISIIATVIHKMLNAVKKVPPKSKIELPTTHTINGEPIEKIIGVKGTYKEGMFKILIGRQIHAGCGCKVGKNMGINTWAAFGGTDDNALVDGDFAILENELQPVLKALANANINIVAIHNHMINEKPRMMFLHYWGQGKTVDLAQGIKSALDKTSTLTWNELNTKDHTQMCCEHGKN